MKLFTLLLALLLSSCAVGKKTRLEHYDYPLTTEAKLTVNSVTRTNDKIVLKLLGISVGEEIIGIKDEDVQCGLGEEKIEDVTISEKVIIMPKTNFIEFEIVCKNDSPLSTVDKPYLFFKNLYVIKENSTSRVISSNVRIDFN